MKIEKLDSGRMVYYFNTNLTYDEIKIMMEKIKAELLKEKF